jgi:hypothetical protein
MAIDPYRETVFTPPPSKPPVAPRLIAIAASASLYALACALPAMSVRNTRTGEVSALGPGWYCALMGPFGILFACLGCIAWCGNPLWLASAVCLGTRKYLAAEKLAKISFLLGLCAFLLFWSDIPMDEAGANQARVSSFGWGYEVWLASLAIPGIAARWLRSKELPAVKSPEHGVPA